MKKQFSIWARDTFPLLHPGSRGLLGTLGEGGATLWTGGQLIASKNKQAFTNNTNPNPLAVRHRAHRRVRDVKRNFVAQKTLQSIVACCVQVMQLHSWNTLRVLWLLQHGSGASLAS